MRMINNTGGGLVLLIDWPRSTHAHYRGFDGEIIWPDAKWQSEESTTLKLVSRILQAPAGKQTFNPITIKNGLVTVDQLNDVLGYKNKLNQKSRLLYLRFSNFTSTSSTLINKNFLFLGYDFGNYVSESNYYSLILHEIIGGTREEFKAYEKYLNDDKLFSSLDIIPSLEKTKDELKTKGESLEDEQEGEEFQPVAIYSYNE